MSNGAVLSLLGMYNWDDSLFDDMSFPEGFTADDKQTFIDNTLLECAELEIIYSNWTFLKGAITAWSAKELPTWQRFYNASLLEYNPIENYNRTEKTNHQNFGKITNSGKDTMQASGSDSVQASGKDTMQASGSDSVQASGKDTMQASGSDSNQASGTDIDTLTGTDSTSRSGTDTDTKSRTSYDSNAYANVEKLEMSKGTLETFNKSETHQHTNGRKDDITYGRKDETTFGRKDETTFGRKDETTFGKVTEDTTGHQITSIISGNIGTMTTQKMLEEELEIAPKLNTINYMIESFKNRFCLLVY